MRPTVTAIAITLLSLLACGRRDIEQSAPPAFTKTRDQACLNLNTATREELMALPGIGEALSRQIIAYRDRRGAFRRPEEIIIIDGFSERKYRAIADLICAH
jgi:competence ComEA-like helix-hairpin-helix protein